MALTKTPIELSSTPSIVDGGNATAITIDSSENIGIGTSSPQAKFSISNDGAEGIEFFPASASGQNSTQHYNRSGAAYLINKQIALDHRFDTSGTERMRIDASGNLGISTSSPVIPVQINNYSGLDGNANQLILSNNTYYSGGDKAVKSGFSTRIDLTNQDGSIRFINTSASSSANAARFHKYGALPPKNKPSVLLF